MIKEEAVSVFAQVGQYSWCIALIGICIGLYGWRVAYKNSIKLATRSESKSLIDSVSKLVNDISDLSIDFWLNKSSSIGDDNNDEQMQKEILIKANQSSSYLFNVLAKALQITKISEVLELRGLLIPDNLLASVLEKATLDCETAYKMNDAVRTQRTQEIVSSCTDVIHALYKTFQHYHPPAKQVSFFQNIRKKYKEIDDWHKSLN